MNHLEQLVREWLTYRGYLVQGPVLVGPRKSGGYEGELDVLGLNLATCHFVHVECSLDALSWDQREVRFAGKFERGRRFARAHFPFAPTDLPLDQVALLHFASPSDRRIGGARLVTGRAFVQEILAGLDGTSSATLAVPSHLPLIRTLQLAKEAYAGQPGRSASIIPDEATASPR
ncbi:MAG: hypothetical protein JSS00_04405 [Proteobacteria bacterium]|nr:hypothetical protein [Pseudomonadota bacterium]